MKFNFKGRWIALLALMTIAGCASSGGSRSERTTYQEDLGRLLAGPLDDVRLEMFNRHSVGLARNEVTTRSILYESLWMPRDVTQGEVLNGVIGARNRVVIRGRMIEQGLEPSANVFRVTFIVENQIRTETTVEWHPGPLPDPALERFRELLSDMKLELNTGVRR